MPRPRVDDIHRKRLRNRMSNEVGAIVSLMVIGAMAMNWFIVEGLLNAIEYYSGDRLSRLTRDTWPLSLAAAFASFWWPVALAWPFQRWIRTLVVAQWIVRRRSPGNCPACGYHTDSHHIDRCPECAAPLMSRTPADD